MHDAPFLGFGVGLRTAHYPDVLERAARGELRVDWFEVVTENFMVPGGRPLRVLEEVRAHTPIVLHGVSLNLGSADPLNPQYLDQLVELARRSEPAWISDHLCWTGVEGGNLHDLLPLPYTEGVIRHVAARIERVQDRLGRRIAIENVSSYLSYCDDEMPEWEFYSAVVEKADIYAIPPERVFQIHLAGHSEQGPLLIDTHDHPVRDEVWQLFESAIARFGSVSTLIEWDDQIPDFDRLEAEAMRARDTTERILETETELERVTTEVVAGSDPATPSTTDHRA